MIVTNRGEHMRLLFRPSQINSHELKNSNPKEQGEGDQTDAKARSGYFPMITEESRMEDTDG
jgi:hypothetical protein